MVTIGVKIRFILTALILASLLFVLPTVSAGTILDTNTKKESISFDHTDTVVNPEYSAKTSTMEKINSSVNANKPTFLFFYMDWCHFCQKQKPIIDTLEDQYTSAITFIRINCEEEPQLANYYKVNGYPTMFLFSPQQTTNAQKKEFVGYTSYEMLDQDFNYVITSGKLPSDSNSVFTSTLSSESACNGCNSDNSNNDIAPVPICGNGVIEINEECDDGNLIEGDGCSNDCLRESVQVYLVPYVGDIDGGIDSDWFFFYEKLIKWHNDNNVPIGMSFYPGTMNDVQFNEIIGEMYDSANIELITKGEREVNGKPLCDMSYTEVKEIIKQWQDKFISELEKLGYKNVKAPVTYNQRLGEFTPVIRDAIHDLGFKIYFEQFITDKGYTKPLRDFDVMQYCVSLAVSGHAGANEVYKKPDQVLQEILNFDHDNMLYINGIKVVSMMVHQQDFRITEDSSVLNKKKWETYTSVLLRAKNDVRIRLLTPEDIYNLRHTLVCGNGVLEIGERCDDGNQLDNDGCSSNCTVEKPDNVCGNGILEKGEQCDDGNRVNGDGCSAICKNEKIILLATDNIQSNYLENVEKIIVQRHIDNDIPITLGVVPGKVNKSLKGKIKEWDEDISIEIAQHDYMNNKTLKGRDYTFQYNNIKNGTDLLNSWGIYPKSFTPAYGQADDTTIRVINDLSFNTLYQSSRPNINNIFGILTISDQLHLCQGDIIGPVCQLKDYTTIKYEVEQRVDEQGVALIMYHIEDFTNLDGTANSDRIESFIALSNSLIKDGFTFMTMEQYFQYKVGKEPVKVCQYAVDAYANSEAEGSFANLATGAPNAPKVGMCGEWNDWSGPGYSWSPATWNSASKLTLSYAIPVYASSITIFGDYNMCWSRIWLRNIITGEDNLVFVGDDGNCTSTHYFNDDIITDSVTLETCGWSWNATDAVELCGTIPTSSICGDGKLEYGEECDDGNVENGDGCNEYCRLEGAHYVCGNRVKQGNEECDDGNLENGDGCDKNCESEPYRGLIYQYAESAEADSEALGYPASHAIGAPDSDGQCNTKPDQYTSWEKANWGSNNTITLTFHQMVYPVNLTVFGDYELCINHIWFWRNNNWYLAWEGANDKAIEDDCTIKFDFNIMDFKTNKVQIGTCAWRWSAIDSVQLCGTSESFPKINIISPVQDYVIDNSVESVNLEIATNIPAACKFSYNEDFKFSDGNNLLTTDGLTHTYNLSRPPSNQSVKLYYKCKNISGMINPYGMMHRFSFREIDKPFIEICDWYGCAHGAASISIDDGYHDTLGYVKATCKEELEKNDLKGTYFLAYTKLYTDADWDMWRDMYNNGHEIGGHMSDCSYVRDEEDYIDDLEANIQDIVTNIQIPRNELTTFAWPCGVDTEKYGEWISKYYLFERGYHVNGLESVIPEDFTYLKSIDSIGFGDNPPDYYPIADAAMNNSDWALYVFHDYCHNSDIFNYLAAKGLWIDTIGSVAKYIVERTSTRMENVDETSGGVTFNVVNDLNSDIFNVNLTLQIYVGQRSVNDVIVNGQVVKYDFFTIGSQRYVKFNIPAQSRNRIEISGLALDVPYCGDGKRNQALEECDDGNFIDGDGCTSNCKTENVSEMLTAIDILSSKLFKRIDMNLQSFMNFFSS